MLRSLVVGLGRSGAELHLRALATAAKSAAASAGESARELFAAESVVGCDPFGSAPVRDGLHMVPSLGRVADLLPVESTVAHVCTPPRVRLDVLTELAELGIRRVIVEKPLATGVDEMNRMVELSERHGIQIVVVAHWLCAELTGRLHGLVQDRTFGPVRRIRFRQHKPRFRRSVGDRGHRTAFDVEVPHSLGVALLLAGPADVRDAECTPLRLSDVTLPWMGGARLVLDHRGGACTEIVSDLGSPVQERSVTLEFESGTAVGHYPLSDRDEHAQLTVHGTRRTHEAFPDDALSAFMRRAYRWLRDHDPALDEAFRLQCDVVRLCDAARVHSGAEEVATRAG